jgi:hypothetical protein
MEAEGAFLRDCGGMPPLRFGEASGCSQSAIAEEWTPGAFRRVFIWIG